MIALFSKPKLSFYQSTLANNDPTKERRNKTLTVLDQQKLILTTTLKAQDQATLKLGEHEIKMLTGSE